MSESSARESRTTTYTSTGLRRESGCSASCQSLSYLLMEYLFTTDLEISPCGQATMIREKQASAEPDKSWCLDEEKEFPDIVLEVVLTNGGLDRLAMYRCFPVPEVWLWRKDGLEIWHLKTGASGYDGPARASRLLPGLDFDLVERCVALPTWREARRAFQQALISE